MKKTKKLALMAGIATAALIGAFAIAGALLWPKDPSTIASPMLALQAPSEVRQGEWLQGLDVVMTNSGEEAFSFSYSGNLLDFEVLNKDGRVVWKHLSASVEPLGNFSLDPGQSQTLSQFHWSSQGQWDLRDPEGFPVSPGQYTLRGVVTILHENPNGGLSTERLVTGDHKLLVREAPLPAYALPVQLELTAPATVRSGELVPMDLRITNTGDKPVVLSWSGGGMFPPENLMDVVIFQNGQPIWRASSAYDVDGSSTFALGAGESVLMSAITFRHSMNSRTHEGQPSVWDQRADCDTDSLRFEFCPQPVGPGTYTVRGVVNVLPPQPLQQVARFTSDRATIATEPRELVVLP